MADRNQLCALRKVADATRDASGGRPPNRAGLKEGACGVLAPMSEFPPPLKELDTVSVPNGGAADLARAEQRQPALTALDKNKARTDD